MQDAAKYVFPFLDAVDLGHLSQTCTALHQLPHTLPLHPPCRLVMMPTTLCTLCDSMSARHTRLVSYTSGWQACDECRPAMLYSHFQWMATSSHLGFHHVGGLSPPLDYVVNFYRCSTQQLQEASLVMTYYEFIDWRCGMLMASCHWGDGLGRLVRLSNLIVHNRRCFGYRPPSLEGLPERAALLWRERLRREYQRANEFYYFRLCLHARGISLSRDVMAHLFRRWRICAH